MKFVLNPLTGLLDVTGTSGGPGPGTGDVNGPTPAASTDNAVVRWDGVTGRLIQNSNAILSDDGVLEVLAVLQQDTIPALATVSVAPGEVYIIGEELNVTGTLDCSGTTILL